jgi:hypothetical protein
MKSQAVLATGVAVLLSLAAIPRAPTDARSECVAIEDFSRAKVGEFPPDWKVREDEGKRVYSVQADGGRRFVRADSKGLGVQAAKAHEWDLDEYPVLAWSWRPVEFPRGADERRSGANDSVLAVYMLVPHSRVRGPKAVKYVWSQRVPAGTRLESNGGLTQVRVLRNGGAARRDWVEERVNVRDDYLKAFNTTEVPKPAGIAILTDADDTGSRAVGDYTNFRACRG